MSYQLNLSSVEKVKEELSLLATTTAAAIYIDTNNPKRLAYLLMQGMSAATSLELPILSALKDNYRICLEATRIKCERITPVSSAPYLEFTEPKELLDLMDVWIENRGLGMELHFPSIPHNDATILEWLENKEHSWTDSGVLVMKVINKLKEEKNA